MVENAAKSTTRPIYLAVQCVTGKRNHWMLFIPSASDPKVGKIINVVGSVYTGFKLEIKDNFTAESERSKHQFVHIGDVAADLVADGYAPDPSRAPTIRPADAPARDKLEQLAAAIPMPYRAHGVQLPPMNSPLWRQPNKDFERCQEWTRRFVGEMVRRGYLHPDALAAVDTGASLGVPGKDAITYTEVLASMAPSEGAVTSEE